MGRIGPRGYYVDVDVLVTVFYPEDGSTVEFEYGWQVDGTLTYTVTHVPAWIREALRDEDLLEAGARILKFTIDARKMEGDYASLTDGDEEPAAAPAGHEASS